MNSAPILTAVLALTGCGDALSVSTPDTETRAIRGGTEDRDDSNVVAVVRVDGSRVAVCSGSLIAPNLVLTAHHCVADLVHADGDQIDCAQSSFAAPDDPAAFAVTTHPSLPQPVNAFHSVHSVVIPPGSDRVCGFDLALLTLTDKVGGMEAIPLEPQLHNDVSAGDHYSAVGFGADQSASDAGVRRRLDGVRVVCGGGSCTSGDPPIIDVAREWLGAEGPCEGDSGGPALDVDGRVIGVVSRANGECTSSIYSDLFASAVFLRQAARSAADFGRYPPAAWVTGGEGGEDSGCGATGAPSVVSLLVALALLGRLCPRPGRACTPRAPTPRPNARAERHDA